jgi:hypothetical protein
MDSRFDKFENFKAQSFGLRFPHSQPRGNYSSHRPFAQKVLQRSCLGAPRPPALGGPGFTFPIVVSNEKMTGWLIGAQISITLGIPVIDLLCGISRLVKPLPFTSDPYETAEFPRLPDTLRWVSVIIP